jgi:hypothetical protein
MLPDSIPPGPLSPATAAGLTQISRRLQEVYAMDAQAPLQIQKGTGPWLLSALLDGFPAKITSGSNPYAWTEQDPTSSGTWTNKSGGRVGTTSLQPAYEFNDSTSVPANTFVWMVPAGLHSTQGREYVFAYTAGDVTNVYQDAGPPDDIDDAPDNPDIINFYLDTVTNILYVWNSVTETWVAFLPGDDPVCGCPHCPDGTTNEWTFTASGFTGDCEDFNGEWSLLWAGCVDGDCTWEGSLGDASAVLAYDGTTWTLTINPGTVTYSVAGGCCSSLVMNDGSVGACSAAPGTLTLTPTGPCEPCDCDCWFTGTETVVSAVSFNSETCELTGTSKTVEVICGKIKSWA